jgi:4a-hydroxytetrahydrobiopterin dehydratase
MNGDPMPAEKMTPQEIDERMATLEDWRHAGGALERELVFRDFVEAFGFVSRVALLAERQNHHPQWSNVYNRVSLSLSTHEAGGISERDFRLASAIDRLLRA